MKKIKVALLFGGRSAEHEVSMQSARNIYASLDKEKYDISLVGITKDGGWFKLPSEKTLLEAAVVPEPEESHSVTSGQKRDVIHIYPEGLDEVDVVFPILHGPHGEDGTVQGMLKLLDLPFVGAGVIGSAIGMDKDVMKRLLRDAGIPVTKFTTLYRVIPDLIRNPQMILKQFQDDKEITFEHLEKEFGLPFFVKPANLGSSIGVSKVHNKIEFNQAIEGAFAYDTKILVEKYQNAREIECSVLGNDDPIASVAGEIIPQGHEFYDYDAKYLDENGAILKVPAEISSKTLEGVQKFAIKTFQTLCCHGMARVDFFLTEEGKLYVNEINTIPGFTKISMYPKLWEASGISYSELVDRLIQLALEQYNVSKQLKTAY